MKRILVLWVLLGWLAGCAESLPSQDRWVELEIGMTPEQVRETVGSPASIRGETWHYELENWIVLVHFENSVVTWIYSTE